MGDLGQPPQRELQKSDGRAGQPADCKITRAMQQARIAYRDTTCNFYMDKNGDSDGSGLCGARNSAPGAAPSVLRSNLGVPNAAALFNRAAGHIPSARDGGHKPTPPDTNRIKLPVAIVFLQ